MVNQRSRSIATISEQIGVGVYKKLETVDYDDPNREKTCLEVDFPILPVNQVAVIEGNVGKPIYRISKWWARRRSSVFRSILLAATIKAPDQEEYSAKTVWDSYYGNHQLNEKFSKLRVIDIFMGGHYYCRGAKARFSDVWPRFKPCGMVYRKARASEG